MDIQSLRFALTLAEELHFGRAANAHYIGAQPFGRRIQDLERELGTRLFERTSRRVSLTAAGERFLPRARRVLDSLDDLRHTADGEHDDSVLRIGVLGFGLADDWPATRAFMMSHHPSLRIAFSAITWDDQYDAVRSEAVDVAVLHDVGGADDLVLEHVSDHGRYAVVPAESELADATRLSASDVVDRPSVTPVGQPGLALWGGDQDGSPHVEVRSPSDIPAAVATTGLLGVSAEPAKRFLAHPGVRYVPLDGPRAITAIASRRGDHRESVSAFFTAVRVSTVLSQLAAATCSTTCADQQSPLSGPEPAA